MNTMDSNEYSSSREDQNDLSIFTTTETNLQQQKKEGLGTKLRQTINAVGKRVQSARQKKTPLSNLTSLTPENQEFILHAVEAIKLEDSKQVMETLDESRNLLRRSYEEFKDEQNEYREQLELIKRNKEATLERRKENAIPLALFLRQKRDTEGLADLDPNTGMNVTYQAYFEGLLSANQNTQQHPSDKAAVVKYIRRRERRKRAQENRKQHELTNDLLEKRTAELIEKMEGMDVKLEHERQRQNDILRTKIQGQKTKTQNVLEAQEIIDQAHEANLLRQRVEQSQRDKIEARLLQARHPTPTNMIHIQSHSVDEDGNAQLTDEQRAATKNSLQLLNESDAYRSMRPATPIYEDINSNEKLANIEI